MIAGIAALLTHPTGIALLIANCIFVLRMHWKLQDYFLTIPLIAAATPMIAHIYTQFFDVRNYYLNPSGIPFWKLGLFYVQNYRGISLIAMTVTGVAVLISLRKFWKLNPWLLISGVLFVTLALASGAWVAFPRFIIPALLVPLSLSMHSLRSRFVYAIAGFALQIALLSQFIRWRQFV